jgi:hypothetical protein
VLETLTPSDDQEATAGRDLDVGQLERGNFPNAWSRVAHQAHQREGEPMVGGYQLFRRLFHRPPVTIAQRTWGPFNLFHAVDLPKGIIGLAPKRIKEQGETHEGTIDGCRRTAKRKEIVTVLLSILDRDSGAQIGMVMRLEPGRELAGIPHIFRDGSLIESSLSGQLLLPARNLRFHPFLRGVPH